MIDLDARPPAYRGRSHRRGISDRGLDVGGKSDARGRPSLHLVRSPAALQMGRRTLVGAITSIAPGCDFVGASRTGGCVIDERESDTRPAGGGPESPRKRTPR